MKKWILKQSETILDSPWLKIKKNSYKMPNGTEIPEYYISERSDSAICICYDGESFIMVKQYRPGIEDFSLCHPGGKIEDLDKSYIDGALRELLEETGRIASKVIRLGSFSQIPAVSNARVHQYLIYCTDENFETQPDITEDIQVVKVKKDELLYYIKTGKIHCLACVAASFLALDFIENIDANGGTR